MIVGVENLFHLQTLDPEGCLALNPKELSLLLQNVEKHLVERIIENELHWVTKSIGVWFEFRGGLMYQARKVAFAVSSP